MTIATYTELKTEVADFAHRSDLTAKMDTFCILAEGVINKDLRSLEMETILDVTFDDAFYDLPSNYLEIRAIHLEKNSARIPIKSYSPQQLDRLYSRATGTANGFAIHGGKIELRPAPSVTSTVDGQISYYKRVTTLTGTSTNDILTTYPLIYLSAMMLQVYLYLQDDTELAKWSEVYNSQIKQANKSAQAGRYNVPQVQAI
jgi:hypothetical protein